MQQLFVLKCCGLVNGDIITEVDCMSGVAPPNSLPYQTSLPPAKKSKHLKQ